MDRYGRDRAPGGMLILGAFAAGVAAMYLLDPEQGNRRRALIRDKLYSASLRSRRMAEMKSRDLANRAQGFAYEACRGAAKLVESFRSAPAVGRGMAD